MLNVLSLFDGMSCGQIALNNLGIKDYKYYASEIDKFAIKVAEVNYPDTIHIGDVQHIVYEQARFKPDKIFFGEKSFIDGAWQHKGVHFTEIDLLIGGSPCQGFSFAGKGLNFEDERSKLFFEFVRLLKEIKPKYFLLENVKMKKEYQDIISEHLFGIQPIVINSLLLTAQNRKRLYWVGILQEDGTYKQANISQPEDRGILLKDILEENVDEKFYLNEKQISKIKNSNFMQEKLRIQKGNKCGTLLARDYKDPKCVNIRLDDFTNFNQDNIFCGKDDKVPTLTAGDGGLRPKLYIPEATKKGFIEVESGDCFDFTQPNSKTRRGRLMKEKSNYLTASGFDFNYFNGCRIRKLTPTECERLQGVAIIEKNYIIDIDLLDNDYLGLDQVKNYVNVENQNHKLQNVVLNAEKEEKKENVRFVEKNLNIKNQQTKKLAQENALINGEQKQIVKFNLNETKLFVNNVEKKENYIHQIEVQDFVLLNVGINTILEKIAVNGKVELHLKGKNYIQLKNGKIVLKGYGKEIMQLVKDVEKNLTIHKKHLKYIIENLSNIKNIEQELTTLFLYVISVIIGYTQDITLTKNILISQERGYTSIVSDSQRYKMLGNGWTIPVIEHIFKNILTDYIG